MPFAFLDIVVLEGKLLLCVVNAELFHQFYLFVRFLNQLKVKIIFNLKDFLPLLGTLFFDKHH